MDIKKLLYTALSLPTLIAGILFALFAFNIYLNTTSTLGEKLNDMEAFVFIATSFMLISISTIAASKVNFYEKSIIKKTYKYFVSILAILFCLHLLYSGLMFMVMQNEEKAHNKALNHDAPYNARLLA